MGENRDYVTRDELGHYATKADLSELKAEFFKATTWLIVTVAGIATSAIVITEHFFG